MLSSANEIADIKKELNTYAAYGYATDAAFVSDLTYAITIAANERMIPILGEDEYDALTDLDSSANHEEAMTYQAEVYYAVAEFLLLKDRKDKYNRKGQNYHRSNPGGESETISGISGKQDIANEYLTKGDNCLAMGGYMPRRSMMVRSSIHDY